jgi:hyperosmotically inducible protein
MKRAPFLLLLAVLALNAGCAAAVMSGAADGNNDWSERTEDSRVTREVRTALYRDAALDAARIGVTTRDGVVTLSGSVEEPGHIDRARQLAAGIAGVREVNIQLRVNGTR